MTQSTRLHREIALEGSGDPRPGALSGRPARSVTVNLAESPLGWLHSRGHVTRRQFDAGEKLRCDWERALLAPGVTMRWDGAPSARGRSGPSREADQAPLESTPSVASTPRWRLPGRAWAIFYGGSSARARGCARPKARSAGRRARARSCFAWRSTGSPTTTRIR